MPWKSDRTNPVGGIIAVLLLTGCGASSAGKAPLRDFSPFNGSYRENSERRGHLCRATVDCDATTDHCRISVERGSWGKDASGKVTDFTAGALKISNETEIASQKATPEEPLITQTASITRTGGGYSVSVINITKRAGQERGSRARMTCESLVKQTR